MLLEALASLSHVLQAAGGADDLADIVGRKDHPRDKRCHVDKSGIYSIVSTSYTYTVYAPQSAVPRQA